MKTFLRFSGLLLLTAGVLFLGGCKEEEKDEIDPALAGNWSNELQGELLKTFTIKSDGSFTATLTVSGGENGTGQGTVTGILVREGNDYFMNNMVETTEASWGSAVSLFNRKYVQITFSNSNNTFELKSAGESLIEQFFGGTYHRQQ